MHETSYRPILTYVYGFKVLGKLTALSHEDSEMLQSPE